MPSRNIKKQQAPESYYHIYARGINKQPLFQCENDYTYFLGLFNRYLSDEEMINKNNGLYPNFVGKVEILAYCIMPTHFHILVYQVDTPYLEKFMQSIMTSYSRYFNLKNKRTGPVYESRYKAVRIESSEYLQHVSRYIHLNPRSWRNYRYSSLGYYLDGGAPEWLASEKILDQFSSVQEYLTFVSDYQEMHDSLETIKHQLADK